LSLTPAQQQYYDLKQQYQDCILFFRLGDFYEVFYEDAKICSRVLDLVLTARNKTAPNPIPMAGIPHHSSDKYIQKLIHHGYKVAIAEQTSEPKPGKIVSREVVSVITPATYLSETSKTSATIAAICMLQTTSGSYHLARGDFAIGAYMTQSYQTLEDLIKQLMIL
jgi:DNA mismatch repair protein MutS